MLAYNMSLQPPPKMGETGANELFIQVFQGNLKFYYYLFFVYYS